LSVPLCPYQSLVRTINTHIVTVGLDIRQMALSRRFSDCQGEVFFEALILPLFVDC